MARAKERPTKTALDTLQDWLSGSGQALADGAQAMQRLVVATGRGVEGQLATLVSSLEETLRTQVDALVTSVAVSLRDEIENVREEVEEIRERTHDEPAVSAVDQMLEPLRALANGALERAAYAQTRLSELAQRIEQVEHRTDASARLAEIDRRLAVLEADLADPAQAEAQRARDGALAEQIAQVEQRVREVRLEIGERAADIPSMRERLAKIEARVLETSKEQIARAGESTSLRDRLSRLEARLTDLSREQVARAVEAAGLRERVFRLEQRAGAYAAVAAEPPAEGERPSG